MAIWKHLKKYRNQDIEKQEKEKMSELEKGDVPAMCFAALFTLWLPSLLILIILCALAYVFLGLPFAH